jgi:alpha-tubulin suppressor-like RCC1 family protein
MSTRNIRITTQNQNRAMAVQGGLRFRSIYAGGALTCGVTTEGAEYCWRLNQDGQLGDGTRESRSAPVRVGG